MDNVQASFISIHIPRVGDDEELVQKALASPEFQSTSPVWGMTPLIGEYSSEYKQFQSTSPVWGMTDQRV